MTRLSFGAFGANSIQLDGLSPTGTPTVVASPFTGGGPYAVRCVGTTSLQNVFSSSFAYVIDRGYYLRARVRISATPSANTFLLGIGDVNPATASAFGLALASGSRDIRIWGGGAARDVAGPTLAVDTDYLLEVYMFYSAAGNDTITGRIDGTQFATFTGALTASFGNTPYFGISANAGITAHYTDWAINDDQSGTDDSWCGDARTAMLLPVSDDTVNSSPFSADSWRLANSGTSNLFTAVDNTPPIGVATPGTTSPASQIVCDTPSVDRNYVAITETYDAKIPASATIPLVQVIVGHAESVNTGTKSGIVQLSANPSDAGTVFTYGDDVGAAGTWATNWRVARGAATIGTSVTRGTGASVLAHVNANTRNVDVCFLGAYVEYVPAIATKAKSIYHRPLRVWPRRTA